MTTVKRYGSGIALLAGMLSLEPHTHVSRGICLV